MVQLPSRTDIVLTGLLLALGAGCGWLAASAGLPMPWMLGSLFSSAAVVLLRPPAIMDSYSFPLGFRTLFVGLIGVMIGTQVTPELASLAGDLPWTMGGLMIYVCLAHAGNTLIFRKIGKFDRATAFYSGTPGGLMESIFLGEGAGADVRILTTQQFLRIIFVITLMPLGLSLWLGTTVGSASGLKLAGGDTPQTIGSLAMIVATGGAGLFLARWIKLPAAQLTGPLLLAAIPSVTGLWAMHLPSWLISAAQVVIGVSLGLRFKGVSMALLRRSAGLSFLSVSFMLILGMLFAELLHVLTGLEVLHLLISFAPGGVAEMSVVALSLAANPAMVSLHHVARILMTVVELSFASKWFGMR